MGLFCRYGIGAVMAACAEYVKATNRRVSFEYALIAGVNDSEETAAQVRVKKIPS
jgi:23S rRNA (adenine2503-C2)-methyltransferase